LGKERKESEKWHPLPGIEEKGGKVKKGRGGKGSHVSSLRKPKGRRFFKGGKGDKKKERREPSLNDKCVSVR